MKNGYKLSRPNSIQGIVQREILERFGDGRPFRWKDVRDAYRKAYKRVRGKDLGVDPTLGVTEFFRNTDWIIHHQDSKPHEYYSGTHGLQQSYYKGIWHTVVPLEQLEECTRWQERGMTKDTGTTYYWDEPGSPKCVVCRKIHPNPINVQRIGRYEVF